MDEKKKKSHKGLTAFLIILIFLVGAVCCIRFVPMIKRDVVVKDITIDAGMDLLQLGVACKVLPQKDIEDLQLTINLLDSNKKMVVSAKKIIGDVKKGLQYDFTYSLTDLGLMRNGVIDYERLEQCKRDEVVAEGTVKMTIWEAIVEWLYKM